ncbi:MAG: electron transfer flavoprotein alpha/ beta subunit [Deltaproteobacteria bacterium]|nr:electron transfer flavoprotein alpha/ beta subunit [Deltaproteobacteria bacterium]
MKQIVLIKQVPAVAELAFDPQTRTLKREGVRLEVSSFDVRALLRAVELRAEHGGEVVVLTMGPPAAREALVYCLALGADRGIHLCDRAFAGADTLATARALAAAVARERPDLVLCGRASVDAETAQVGPEVAELLDVPQVCSARTLVVDAAARTFTAERETDDGAETVTGALPALVTAGEDLAPERFPRRGDKEAAKVKPIVELTAAALGLDATTIGAAGSPTWVEGLEAIDVARPGRVLEGGVDAAIATLVAELEARGIFAPAGIGDPGDAAPAASAPTAERAGAVARDRDVWVVAELFDGAVRRVTLELLARARRLAAARGGRVAAVLLGHDVGRHVALLAGHGADRVLVADDPRLATYATEPYAALLARAIGAERPGAVLVPSTYVGRDLAPRVAGRLGLGLTGDCVDLSIDDEGRLVQWKPAFGGNVVAPILSRTRPEMATVRPGVLPAASARAGATARADALSLVDLPASRLRVVDRRRDPSAARAAALDEAEIAVGVGLGIGGPEALPVIEALAAALGGAPPAATRDVVDKGWLPRQRQVGLTGRAIAPRCYFAIGIRGAAEHMVGVRRSGTIVAVDKNPQAPIFAQADLGIVGDWAEVVPRLTHALAARRKSSE